jgi:hypothetical protein
VQVGTKEVADQVVKEMNNFMLDSHRSLVVRPVIQFYPRLVFILTFGLVHHCLQYDTSKAPNREERRRSTDVPPDIL